LTQVTSLAFEIFSWRNYLAQTELCLLHYKRIDGVPLQEFLNLEPNLMSKSQ